MAWRRAATIRFMHRDGPPLLNRFLSMMARPRPCDSPTRNTLGALSESTSVNGSKSKRGLYRHWYQISTSPDTFWVFLSSCKSSKHHRRTAALFGSSTQPFKSMTQDPMKSRAVTASQSPTVTLSWQSPASSTEQGLAKASFHVGFSVFFFTVVSALTLPSSKVTTGSLVPLPIMLLSFTANRLA